MRAVRATALSWCPEEDGGCSLSARVLITGASGFVGRHCIPLLVNRGFEVHAVARHSAQTATPDEVTWHRCDLLRQSAVEKLVSVTRPSHLFHLAWFTEPGAFWESPANLRWQSASIQLFNVFRKFGGRRILSTGSCAEYDWNAQPCREGFQENPGTQYGRSKVAICRYLQSLTNEDQLSTAWGRLFFLYGPAGHASRMPAAIILSLLNGQTARCTHGRQLRDFLFIQDAADALVNLLDSDLCGPVNIGSGQATRVLDMVHATAARIGREELLQIGAIAASPEEPAEIVADTSRLRNELEWQPEVSLEDGIRRTINWWKNQRQAGAA
jgi:nucleoside-diphosphate-sugar epimerase